VAIGGLSVARKRGNVRAPRQAEESDAIGN
jgi:hypothetical protein